MASPESRHLAENGRGYDGYNGDLDRQLSVEQTDQYALESMNGIEQMDTSNAGAWTAANFLWAINAGDFIAALGIPINLVPYLAGTMHQSLSKAANINTNFLGTSYLLSVLGGFLADSYLGSFYTIVSGAIAMILGLGLLTFSTAYSGLQPPPCESAVCSPAGRRYMAPLYLALYTIALGTGLEKPNIASLGADQFDESNPVEKKQGVHFFVWFYFFTNIGLLIAFTLGVYLQDNVSRSWGYGFALMFYFTSFAIFLLGATKYRRKRPTGSFLTRTAQVLVASLLKRNAPIPEDAQELYNPSPYGRLSQKLRHTNQLRFLDKAAVMDKVDTQAGGRGAKRPNPWRLCSVTQVEESKRLVQFLPVWATIAAVTLVFAQLTTFTVQQGQTLDRKLAKHFVVPSASLGTITTLSTLLFVPVYDWLLVPILRRFTRNPYGFTPLQRLGISISMAVLTMMTAALVERKRLTYVRNMHVEALPLGAYVLPMEMWWLLPQFFLSSQVEIFLYIASYQFFYHEAAETTQSVGTSFTYSASAMGYFFSTVIVDIVNRVTRNNKGGSWLEGKLNDGGLEHFYWLLAVLLSVDLVLFLAASYFYRYKYDWKAQSR